MRHMEGVCYGPEVWDNHLTGAGRPWTVEELRHKSWEDLHSLWYKCCIERNRIATEIKERKRLQLGDQEHQSHSDDFAVGASSDTGYPRTMRNLPSAVNGD